MKVNNKAPQLVQDSAIANLKGNGAKKTKTDAAKAAEIMDATKINMSPKARQANKAKEIASHHNVDEAKIARLQAAIDSGSYKVDAEKVADKLVDEHLMLP